jgi:hypothetical protein
MHPVRRRGTTVENEGAIVEMVNDFSFKFETVQSGVAHCYWYDINMTREQTSHE